MLVPDRVKQRREYLKKKGLLYLRIAGSLAGVLLCLALVLIYIRKYQQSYLLPIGLVLLTGFLIAIGLLIPSLIKDEVKEAQGIPYVPPLTPDELPADEVLVRGAEKPAVAESEVLLRVPTFQTATAAEQLLRSSGQPGKIKTAPDP